MKFPSPMRINGRPNSSYPQWVKQSLLCLLYTHTAPIRPIISQTAQLSCPARPTTYTFPRVWQTNRYSRQCS